jgi:high affinity Mn2+ porin
LLPYVTTGAAWARTRIDINGDDGEPVGSRARTQPSRLGRRRKSRGFDGRQLTGKIECNYIDLGIRTYHLNDAGLPSVRVDPNIHTIKFAVNYRLLDVHPWTPSNNFAVKRPAVPESPDWNIHAQTTLIPQRYPSFRSPYQGANSLPGAGRVRETWTVRAFLGWRL